VYGPAADEDSDDAAVLGSKRQRLSASEDDDIMSNDDTSQSSIQPVTWYAVDYSLARDTDSLLPLEWI